MPSKISSGSFIPKEKTKPDASDSVATGAHARISSQALFQGASVLEVEHNGQIYRLQKTALNKLILTK